jgi:16S rRNA (cytidine1402-2'-O)-methyltransferase
MTDPIRHSGRRAAETRNLTPHATDSRLRGNDGGGILYIVGTPIGNLGDITLRAIETLKTVDTILTEDTRHSKKLLNHYEITTPVMSFHQYSRGKKIDTIFEELGAGKDLALITDAGTPAIADPGSKLVEMVRQRGHQVVPIPGPTAVTSALSAVGLGGDEFTFLGFLPHKKGRQTKVKALDGMLKPVVLYEAPTRLTKLLTQLDEYYPEAQVVVARELTKKFEEFKVGTPAELLEWYTEHPPKGEIVVVVRTS